MQHQIISQNSKWLRVDHTPTGVLTSFICLFREVMAAPNVLRTGIPENIFVEIQDGTLKTNTPVEIRALNHPTKSKVLSSTSVSLNTSNNYQAFGQILVKWKFWHTCFYFCGFFPSRKWIVLGDGSGTESWRWGKCSLLYGSLWNFLKLNVLRSQQTFFSDIVRQKIREKEDEMNLLSQENRGTNMYEGLTALVLVIFMLMTHFKCYHYAP